MKTLLANRKCFMFILVTLLISFTQGSYGQTITASVQQSLTEATLHGSVVTLTLAGGTYERSEWDIEDAVSLSGIEGVTVGTFGIDRVSDTEVTIELEFAGDIDTNGTLTFTVGAGAIAGYNGNVLTASVTVTAFTESLVSSTEFPLTEANLHGSVVTLTLSGRRFADRKWDIEDAVSLSGIEGVTVEEYPGVQRVSDTEVTVELAFNGDFDTDGTLTLTVGADAIAGYNQDFTFEFPVTAVEESLVVSTGFSLTEATLHGSVVTLTLSGRRFNDEWDIDRALTVSGIEGVTAGTFGVNRVSDGEATVKLVFDGTDFDTDATLTFTVGADAIVGYNEDFTAQIPVTATQQSNATVSVSPSPVVFPAIGEQLTLSLNITNGENVAGYQATVLFDRTALRFVEGSNGDYLTSDAFFVDPNDSYDYVGTHIARVILAASTLDEARNGSGTLASFTLEVVDVKASTPIVFGIYLIDPDGKRWEATTESGEVIEPPVKIVGDVDHDGVVDIQDLVIVGARFGQRGQNSADINGDGLVDIVDLVLVAGAFTEEAAAPSLYPQALELLTAADVHQWLIQAEHLARTDSAYLNGISVLEQLLTALTPNQMALLPNFPNPFNPETWIPYHLSNDADVQISIYDSKGVLVRWLDLGHQMAGYYADRTKAAYWDGRNEFGEHVASGAYFYHLSAGDYSATRKMLILK